jgi:hypothetical protein
MNSKNDLFFSNHLGMKNNQLIILSLDCFTSFAMTCGRHCERSEAIQRNLLHIINFACLSLLPIIRPQVREPSRGKTYNLHPM